MSPDPFEAVWKSASSSALAAGLKALVKLEPEDRGEHYDGLLEEAANRLEKQ